MKLIGTCRLNVYVTMNCTFFLFTILHDVIITVIFFGARLTDPQCWLEDFPARTKNDLEALGVKVNSVVI